MLPEEQLATVIEQLSKRPKKGVMLPLGYVDIICERNVHPLLDFQALLIKTTCPVWNRFKHPKTGGEQRS